MKKQKIAASSSDNIVNSEEFDEIERPTAPLPSELGGNYTNRVIFKAVRRLTASERTRSFAPIDMMDSKPTRAFAPVHMNHPKPTKFSGELSAQVIKPKSISPDEFKQLTDKMNSMSLYHNY